MELFIQALQIIWLLSLATVSVLVVIDIFSFAMDRRDPDKGRKRMKVAAYLFMFGLMTKFIKFIS